MPLPPGRHGPTMLERVARGGPAEAFAAIAVRFLKEKVGELDPVRIATMSYLAKAPRHREWPYVPPDHELLFDVITTDGVGYLFRYGDGQHPPPPEDDPLFAPIQPPLPLSTVDISMCGALLFTNAFREIVIVANLPLEQTLLDKVGRHNNIVANLLAKAPAPPTEPRAVRLMSFPWDPGHPDEWRKLDASRGSPSPDASQSPPAPGPIPGESPALAAMHRGNRLAERGRFDDAIRYHDEALQLDPQLALAWSNKAYALSALCRMEESRAAAARAVELDPKLVVGWINVSNALVSLGRYADALRACERGLSIAPTSPQLHYNLATAADKTYKQPLAVKHYLAFVEHATPAMHAEVARVQQRLRMYRH